MKKKEAHTVMSTENDVPEEKTYLRNHLSELITITRIEVEYGVENAVLVLMIKNEQGDGTLKIPTTRESAEQFYRSTKWYWDSGKRPPKTVIKLFLAQQEFTNIK
jgi:hypothetical protein